MRNHNHLLGSIEGVDGIKTGFTRASGFNLVTSVHRDGHYIVAVVMGGHSSFERDAHMRELINSNLRCAMRSRRLAGSPNAFKRVARSSIVPALPGSTKKPLRPLASSSGEVTWIALRSRIKLDC
jgi:D-alanyl-D-alanine carboxypeptidase